MSTVEKQKRIRRISQIRRARELAAAGQVADARNLVAGHPGPVVVIEVDRTALRASIRAARGTDGK